MSHSTLFNALLKNRGLATKKSQNDFLHPNYDSFADPLLLPDMEKAVQRIKTAYKKKEKIVIYGDYDIDGLSATAVLYDAFCSFGLQVATFIPSRFDDGYGLSNEAIEKLAEHGATLIVTVDCGSLSVDEIAFARTLGVDVIVTDHHIIGEILPDAVAIINPQRDDHTYPFNGFSGVGVAFQLVRALQQQLKGIKAGQEKWLLDLVALGTICDVVDLRGENRILVYWGLKVLQKTRRPGLQALMAVAKVDPHKATTQTVGFMLGPRLNASGRLKSAQTSLDLLVSTSREEALSIAMKLNEMNQERRERQQLIFQEATAQADTYKKDSVLVLSHSEWSHGIIGIVAAKIMETYKKPTFVLQELGDETKGSARSFGDFSVGMAVASAKDHIIKGGGHALAAGVSLSTQNIALFRQSVNEYYQSLQLIQQDAHLRPQEEIVVSDISDISIELVKEISLLEPFGQGNPQPIFKLEDMTVVDIRRMGDNKQHVRMTCRDQKKNTIQCIAFSAPKHFFIYPDTDITLWVTLEINEWQGNSSLQARLLELQ